MFKAAKLIKFLSYFALVLLVSCGGEGEDIPSLLTPPDFTSPTISTITPTTDQTYIYNDNMQFSIQFSEAVYVTGVPSLEIIIDGSNFNIPVSSGSGTSTLVFNKNLNMERLDNDGVDLNQVNLNGGSIKDSYGNTADLTLTPVNYPAVLVDSIKPILTSVILNTGEVYTQNTAANINSVTSGADEMIVSTASDCSVGSFVAYNSSLPHVLNSNIINNIFVQFRNFAGNKTICSQLTITHDNQNPDAPVISQTGDATTSQTDAASWLAVSDNGPAGVLRYEYAVSTTADEVGIIAGGNWSDIGSVLTYQLTSGVTLATATDYYTLVKSVDNAFNESTIAVSASWQILSNPIINSLDINGGALYTNDVNATININVSNADEMIVSTANDCSTGSWEPYATSKAYVLPSANALNNVYLQFRNASGGISTCDALAITHDNQNPDAPVISQAGDATTSQTDAASWLAVSDNGPAGVLRYEYAVSTTADEVGIIAGGNWSDIGTVLTYQLTSGVTLATATDYYTLVKSVDNALNESTIAVSSSWQILVVPTINSLDINGGALYTNDVNATININVSDADEMIVSTANDCSTGSWEPYATSKAYVLPSTNALNNVYLQFRNASGGISTCDALAITHDNQNPDAPVISQAGDATTSQTDAASWLAVSDNGPAGVLRYEYAVSTTADEVGIIAGGNWSDIGTVLTYQLTSGVTLATATDYYTLVKSVDNALNESTIAVSSSWQILVVPTINSLDINGGALYTNDVNATININVSDADEMIVSTANDCSTGSWEPYATSKAYVLPSANALNNVYLQFRNASGGISTCDALAITHDNQNPNNPTLGLSGDASDIASDTTSWAAPSDNGPAGILKYEFAISTTTSEAGIIAGGNWVDIGSNTSHQIASGISLATATNYYSLVKTIDNALNESIVASAAWQITIPPNPISNLEASDRTTESISLGWAIPVDNGIPVTDYQIEYQGDGVGVWTLINDGVSTDTFYTHAGLTPETEYQYRVRAYNGASYSDWSNTLVVETLPDLPFFEPGFKAINVGGAATNSVVSFDDANDIYLNGVLLTTLNKSDTYVFASADFDVLEGTKAFFVAGRSGGTGGGATSANITWLTQAWVGKEYFFNLTRNGPLQVKVFAFEDSTVTIKQGTTTIAGPQFIAADSGFTFSLGTNASYQLTSTGYVGGYVYANQGGNYYDPRPLIPSSTDIIGFPSNSANITSGTDGNGYNYVHSDGATGSGTLNAGVTQNLSPSGGASLYSGNSLRVMSTDPITGISTADSNGLAAAPFMPVSMFKLNFGINVDSDWIAFASDRPVTITQTLPNGTTSNFSLVQTGSGPNRPYRYYISANQLAGTLYSGDDKFQMWYEPESTNGAAVEDETVAFGWD